MKKYKKRSIFIVGLLLLIFFFLPRSEPAGLQNGIGRIELFDHTTGVRYILEPEDVEVLLSSLRFYRASRLTAHIAPALGFLHAEGIYSFIIRDHDGQIIGRMLRGTGNVIEIDGIRYHFGLGAE